MSNFLAANIAKALQKFYEINGTLPARILFFRDGVGDGQVRKHFTRYLSGEQKTNMNTELILWGIFF